MRQLLLIGSLLSGLLACAQTKDDHFSVKEAERLERVLAADDMKGRRTGSPELDRAAAFIAGEFKAAGLQPARGDNDFLQSFSMVRPRFKGVKAEIKTEAGEQELNPKNVIVFTSEPDLKVNEKMGYRIERISGGAADNRGHYFTEVQRLLRTGQNTVVFVDTVHAAYFGRVTGLKQQMFRSATNTVFILGNYQPKEFTVKAEHDFTEVPMANVVGVLPGKSKPEEIVIFSAHYDHLGVGKAVNGDSIYNGANDDAAGTTAVMLLARHFRQMNNNERTIVFAAFTAEEMGMFGSQYFSRQFDPAKVVSMINIEMIGTESKWGKNSAFITGYEKSDLGKLLQEGLSGSGFTFHPDPYTQLNLFYRSDNATLARLGVPAHTVSTSKMDNEPYYHSPDDEVETLDLANMVQIIRSIAIASAPIISGKVTPTRVAPESLR